MGQGDGVAKVVHADGFACLAGAVGVVALAAVVQGQGLYEEPCGRR